MSDIESKGEPQFSDEERAAVPVKEGKIASSIEELPPLREDYIRLLHFTRPEAAEEILTSGLNYLGDITSTARGWDDESEVDYNVSSDPRFSYEGVKLVVIDMPIDEHRLHTRVTTATGNIPGKYVVGIIDPSKPEK